MRIYTGRIDAKNAAKWFGFAENFIRSALAEAHGEISVDDVRRALVDGKMQLFIILTGEDDTKLKVMGAAVTEVVDYYQSAAVRVVTLGGMEMDLWFASLDVSLERFAREMGAKRIEAACRPGFTRVLAPYGYTQYYVILGREVKDGKSGRDNTNSLFNGSAGVPVTLH